MIALLGSFSENYSSKHKVCKFCSAQMPIIILSPILNPYPFPHSYKDNGNHSAQCMDAVKEMVGKTPVIDEMP